MNLGPTEKQVRFALALLDETGYGCRYMDSRFKELGATMNERSGPVEVWLKSMYRHEVARLIDSLKRIQDAQKAEANESATSK